MLKRVRGRMMDVAFYKNKRVFITGHTGFKGTWLCRILIKLGAHVTGFALEPPTTPSLFHLTKTASSITSILGDVRDGAALTAAIQKAKPEVVFHLAAQPLVRESYAQPVLTYATNVMGTVNILEAIRATDCVQSFVNVTTDKVYRNKEWLWGYRENEELCGFDPYSNSKSCSELVTYSYKNSFFAHKTAPAISTARSGNVIGGGDFATDRIIPDCIRAAEAGQNITVRNPQSTRPYQHVLECLSGYLLLAQKQAQNKELSGSYNFGPDDNSCVTTGALATLFCHYYKEGTAWCSVPQSNAPHEANFLKLDCSKSKSVLGWYPRWDIDTAVQKVVAWQKDFAQTGDAAQSCDKQIQEYFLQND